MVLKEVLKVKVKDLMVLNLGLLGGERLRVDTWHNVLYVEKDQEICYRKEREKAL